MKLVPLFEMPVAKGNTKSPLKYEEGEIVKGEYDNFTILKLAGGDSILKNKDGYLVKGSPDGGAMGFIFDTPTNNQKYKKYLDGAELVPFLEPGDAPQVYFGGNDTHKVTVVCKVPGTNGDLPVYVGKSKNEFSFFSHTYWADNHYMYSWSEVPATCRKGDGIDKCMIADGLSKIKLKNLVGAENVDKMVAAGYKLA